MSSNSSSSSSSSSKRKNICSRILTPKQVGPICWFMATFVAMFYSQRSRKILLEASKNWDTDDELFDLLKKILHDKYLKTASRVSEDYRNFSDDTFQNVLYLLHNKNPKSFPYDPFRVISGFRSMFYIGRLYKLLNIDYKIFDYCYTIDSGIYTYMLAYSNLNEELEYYDYRIDEKGTLITEINSKKKNIKYKENNVAPTILLLAVYDTITEYEKNYTKRQHLPSNIISVGDEDILQNEKNAKRYIEGNTDNLKSMRDTIYYNGFEYNLDSAILVNWNTYKRINVHEIVGITCERDKYVYNGWVRSSMDPVMAKQAITRKIPCELMKYDWNIQKDNDFCLNIKKCIPEVLKGFLSKGSLCFNFSNGEKMLVYVREEIENKIKGLLHSNKRGQQKIISKITDIKYIESIIKKLLLTSYSIKKSELLWLLVKREEELQRKKRFQDLQT